MADINYKIVEECGVISSGKGGWTKELNLISWNGGKPKYDIRDWAPEREKMGKGVTLTEDELDALKILLQKEPGTVPVQASAPEKEDTSGNFVTMKALSIHPIYAMCIVTGQKTVECRSWTTNYRGDILICSTAKKEKGTIPGHALGVVTLKDIVPFQRKHLKGAMMDSFSAENYAWILANPRVIGTVKNLAQI